MLLALDAVIRNGSVTAAAQELHLTQGAVSRLIAGLEGQLGRELFTRSRKKLIPTPAALSYHRELARALDLIQRASATVVANPEGGTISLAVLPTFATRWLGPRLARFLTDHPGIFVNLSTRINRVDFTTDTFDAAIYFGEADWPGLQHLKLFDERVTACAAPGFAAAHDLTDPARMTDHTLLYLQSRPNAWPGWFAAHGVAAQSDSVMMMDQFSMMIQAAISGIGIALLPDYLAQEEIATGHLVPLHRQAVPMQGSYWLAWRAEQENLPPLAALRDWLRAEVTRAA